MHDNAVNIFQYFMHYIIHNVIRESVDSLCRDGADAPTKSPNKCNGSELSNAAVISLSDAVGFRGAQDHSFSGYMYHNPT